MPQATLARARCDLPKSSGRGHCPSSSRRARRCRALHWEARPRWRSGAGTRGGAGAGACIRVLCNGYERKSLRRWPPAESPQGVAEILPGIDLLLDAGRAPGGPPSTIVALGRGRAGTRARRGSRVGPRDKIASSESVSRSAFDLAGSATSARLSSGSSGIPPVTSTPNTRSTNLPASPSAAGAQVVLRMMQDRPRPDPATFLGSGKVKSLAAACDELNADVVIFDNELSPAQLRNLEEALDRKVVDRTQLILDIFARRARTREGKLQVELAQLKYLLPRLVGSSCRALAAGRRHRHARPRRNQARDRSPANPPSHQRARQGDRYRSTAPRRSCASGVTRRAAPTVALVGYTNAGKTTLFNASPGMKPWRRTRSSSRSIRSCGKSGCPIGANCSSPTRSVSSSVCRLARRRLPRHARRGGRGRPAAPRHRRVEPGPRAADGGGCRRSGGGRRRPRPRRRCVQQVRQAGRRGAQPAAQPLSRGAVRLGADAAMAAKTSSQQWKFGSDSTPPASRVEFAADDARPRSDRAALSPGQDHQPSLG